MSKIDQVEDLKNLLQNIAVKVSLQRFTNQLIPSEDQNRCNCYQYLFSQLKNEISKNLGILDAYFQTSSEFFDFELCDEILSNLNALSSVISNILETVSNFGSDIDSDTDNDVVQDVDELDEEGGIYNA